MSPLTDTGPRVGFVPFRHLWESFDDRLVELVQASGATDVGELGGGANPSLAVTRGAGRPVELTVLDISYDELAKAPSGVRKLRTDLCGDQPPVRERFDVVFSRMLCEHVPSGVRFHRNCRAMLRAGGNAMHFFPTVTALPFVVNRVLPEVLGERIVEAILPSRRRGGKHSKFPAYYRWCWGPTPQQLARYRSLGFDVVSYDAGIGHAYYDKVPVLRDLERAKSRFLLEHPTPWLTAYALVVLRARP